MLPLPSGKISLATNIDHEEPATDSEEDRQAAERAYQFMLGWFAHPIYVNGDYPQVMKDRIANKSTMQGLIKSRLPEFTDQEKKEIAGKTRCVIICVKHQRFDIKLNQTLCLNTV